MTIHADDAGFGSRHRRTQTRKHSLGLAGRMTPDDYRGLTPLIYSHVNPYGRFDLDMNARLLLD